jgi:adenylate cyclase
MPPGAAIFAAMSDDQSYQRFFAELKRRKVFRVAAVYGAVAFIVLQAADILVPALALPDSLMRGIALISVLFFPVALVLAWAFEMTPDGVRRTDDAEKSPR